MPEEISEILSDSDSDRKIDPIAKVPQKVIDNAIKHAENYINGQEQRAGYLLWCTRTFWGRVYWDNQMAYVSPILYSPLGSTYYERNPIKRAWNNIISRPFMQKIAKQKEEEFRKKLNEEYPLK